MRYSLAALAATAVLAGMPVRGAAQSGCERELKAPEPGQWAEYESEIEGEHVIMRYARLPQQPTDSGNVWIEVSMNKGKKAKDAVIYQVLVPGFPFRAEEAQEVVYKAGEKSKATKVGPMMMRMVGPGLQKSGALKPAEVCDKVTLVGNQRQQVQGGTFSTRHYKYDQGSDPYETWVSAEVPFGLVKYTGRRFTMELSRSGKDAKSSITETPEEAP